MIGLDLMASTRCARRRRLAGFADVRLGDETKSTALVKYGSGGEGDQGPPGPAAKTEKKKDEVPVDTKGLSGIFNMLASMTEGAGNFIKSEQQAGATREATDLATRAAIDADRQATAAVAKAAMSLDLSRRDKRLLAQAKRDLEVARMAVAAQDAVGKNPSVDVAARVSAAQSAVDLAKDDITRGAAWRTLARIRGDAPTSGSTMGAVTDQEGVLARKIAGPVRVWHALLGALGLGGAALLWRSR